MAKSVKKLSASAWVLIAILIIVPVVLIVLHFTYHYAGFGLDLTFLGDWAVSYMMFGTSSGWNALIVSLPIFGLGVFAFYVVKTYFIGEKQIIYNQPAAPAYTPAGQTISNNQQTQEETVVSN